MGARTLLYRLLEFVAVRLGHKKVFQLNAAGLRAFLEQNRTRQKAEPPGYIKKRHNLVQETIEGRPCYIITPREKGGGGAVLFLHGGGYIFEAHRIHWRAASLLVQKLDIPVWFPAYPLAPGARASDAVSMAVSVYRLMLEQYPPEQITLLGDSAGAALALSLCHYITREKIDLPMPGKLVLVSPGMMIEDNEEILREMWRLDRFDIMLSMTFMDSMREVFNLDASRDNYYNSPFWGDFSRFPPMHIFSGTFECLYPQVEAFVARLKAAGLSPAFYSGKEMMHVWPYMPLARECKEALNLVFESIGRR